MSRILAAAVLLTGTVVIGSSMAAGPFGNAVPPQDREDLAAYVLELVK